MDGAASSQWNQALAAFEAARQRHEAFLGTILDPAVHAAREQELGLMPHINTLEDEESILCAARHNALRALAAVPAPDLEQLVG